VLNIADAAGLGFEAALGRRTRIQGQQSVSYTPLFAFNPFPVLAPSDLGQVEAPSADLALGRQDSLVWGSAVGVSYVLGPRSSLAAGYGFDSTRFSADLADQRFHTATVRADHEIARNRQVAVSYRLRDGEYDINGELTPARTHEADLSLDQQWVHSPTRRTTLQVTGGVALVDSTGERTARPVGRVQFASLLGASWTIRSSFGRAVDAIPGLADLTSTDALGAGVGGLLSERLDLNIDAGLSKGDSLGSNLGRFRSHTGTVRLGIALTSVLAAFSEFYYYQYETAGTAATTGGVDDWFNRRGFRVGVTLWAPLVRRRQQS
jgi:hypothetical protein